jgi:DNA-binding transcriptional regulator GbsR (MarR family)
MPLTFAETASREGVMDEIGDIFGLLYVDLDTRIGLGYL